MIWIAAVWEYEVVWRIRRWRERLAMVIAWHCIPYEVRKWVVIRAFADENPDHAPGDMYKRVMKAMR